LARERQLLVGRFADRVHDFDERRRRLLGFRRQRRLGRRAFAHAVVN
jgi:hypothetical protein